MITLQKFEQSAFLLTDNNVNQTFAFDFGIFSEAHIPSLPNLKAVFISHLHADHYKWENIKGMKAENVYAADEPNENLHNHGISSFLLVNRDQGAVGAIEVGVFDVNHGEISKPISNLGFDILIGGKRILFVGDMKLAGEVPNKNYDLVLIPVGGGKVFNIQEAVKFLNIIQHTGLVVPMHYHGEADQEAGKKFRALAGKSFQVEVLDVKEKLELI